MANLRELLAQVESKQKINEAYKRKGKKNNKKKQMVEANLEALSAILEMVENDSLSELELENLMESIETIFNSVLTESEDEDYEDYEDEDYEDEDYEDEDYEDEDYEDEDYEDEDYEDESFYICNDDAGEGCTWEGIESELVENEDGDFVCPMCGSSVSEASMNDEENEDNYGDYEDYSDEDYSDEEEMYEESLVLGKTSMKDRLASKKYGMTAAGKKSQRVAAKKRAKFASKIDMCSEKGKTFSFKDMTCVRTKKRRGTK